MPAEAFRDLVGFTRDEYHSSKKLWGAPRKNFGAYRMLSRAHIVGWIVPLLVAVSPMAFSRLHVGGIPGPVHALLSGVLAGCLAWVFLRYVPVLAEPYPFAKAVLLGVLVAEGMVFHASPHVPKMKSLALFLFLYFYSTESSGAH